MSSFIRVALVLIIAAGCAHTTPEGPRDVVPAVDHHQHLLSPAGAVLVNRALPVIELPPAIERVVVERVTRWNDRAGLRELYSDDALVLGPEAPWWVRGGDAAADLLSTVFARPFDLQPVIYRASASSALVGGYFVRRGDPAATPIARFFLALERNTDGAWQIAAELPIMGLEREGVVTAEQLVAMLDEAGIRRAVVLSNAYYFDSPRDEHPGDVSAVRAENDWTAEQTARYPGRLIAFCSVNPLSGYSIGEIDRCAASGGFEGVKLHFNTSGVDLLNRDHVEKVRAVAAAANRNRLALILHVRSGGDYGRQQARVLLDEILVEAPDAPVQIAHLWGGESFSSDALTAYAEAVETGHAGARNLYFDVAQISLASEEVLRESVALMRRIGMDRILYGSDGPQFGGMPPADAWTRFRARVSHRRVRTRSVRSTPTSHPLSSTHLDNVPCRG